MSSTVHLRLIGAIIFGLGGWWLGSFIGELYPPMEGSLWNGLFTIFGAGIGFALAHYPQRWLRRKIKEVPAHTLFAATVGLIIALLLSAILAVPLSLLPGLWGKVTPAIVFLVLSYLGISIMVLRSRDVVPILGTTPSVATMMSDGRDGKVILDTNSIIDGRIADIRLGLDLRNRARYDSLARIMSADASKVAGLASFLINTLDGELNKGRIKASSP